MERRGKLAQGALEMFWCEGVCVTMETEGSLSGHPELEGLEGVFGGEKGLVLVPG